MFSPSTQASFHLKALWKKILACNNCLDFAVDIRAPKEKDGRGVHSTSFLGNSVCNSERIETFELNFAALIQVSIETFCHSYTWNSKHLPLRKLQLFITTYYLKVSWHDMNLKLLLGILFDKWSWSMIMWLFWKMYSGLLTCWHFY